MYEVLGTIPPKNTHTQPTHTHKYQYNNGRKFYKTWYLKEQVWFIKKINTFSQGICCQNIDVMKIITKSKSKWEGKRHIHITVIEHIDLGNSTTMSHLIYKCGGISQSND